MKEPPNTIRIIGVPMDLGQSHRGVDMGPGAVRYAGLMSEYLPPRIPSKKWRELIKKVWEVDPLICPHCGAEMKLIALIDDDEVIEKILRHLKLWPEQAEPACLSRAPPDTPPPDGVDRIIEPFFDDPFPDYDTEPVMAYAKDPDFAA